MLEVVKFVVGIFILVLGFPTGDYLAKITKEEIKEGKIYFNILVWIGLVGGIVGLIIRNDAFLFSMLFIAIVTSRSLKG